MDSKKQSSVDVITMIVGEFVARGVPLLTCRDAVSCAMDMALGVGEQETAEKLATIAIDLARADDLLHGRQAAQPN